jgi:hypothetical protein
MNLAETWNLIRRLMAGVGDPGEFSFDDYTLRHHTPAGVELPRPVLPLALLAGALLPTSRVAVVRSLATVAGRRLGLSSYASILFGETLAHLIEGRPGVRTSTRERQPLYDAFRRKSRIRRAALFTESLSPDQKLSPALISGVAAMFATAHNTTGDRQ